MPKHVSDALRHTGVAKFKKMLPVLWLVTQASNVQRGDAEHLSVPFMIEKCHVVRVVC